MYIFWSEFVLFTILCYCLHDQSWLFFVPQPQAGAAAALPAGGIPGLSGSTSISPQDHEKVRYWCIYILQWSVSVTLFGPPRMTGSLHHLTGVVVSAVVELMLLSLQLLNKDIIWLVLLLLLNLIKRVILWCCFCCWRLHLTAGVSGCFYWTLCYLTRVLWFIIIVVWWLLNK